MDTLVRAHFANKKHAVASGSGGMNASITGCGDSKALVIFLYGPPGTGKSSTVRCIANELSQPVLRVNAVELPSKEHSTGAVDQMMRTFALASRWSCIVVDEFVLPDALKGDQSQAASITRVINSFTGVLFVLCNRVPTANATILSLVHIAFRYPRLDFETTLHIFKLSLKWLHNLFLNRHPKPTKALLIDEEDVLEFAQRFYKQRPEDRWNGRQIRNAAKFALSLAEADAHSEGTVSTRVTLSSKHFELVATAHSDFASFLRSVAPSDAQPESLRIQRKPQFMARSQRALRAQHQAPTDDSDSGSDSGLEPSKGPLSDIVDLSDDVPTAPHHQGPSYPVLSNPTSLALSAPLSLEARPELGRMGWQKFKESRGKRGRECCAIDVLIGEPDITFDDDAFESLWRSRWIEPPGKGRKCSESPSRVGGPGNSDSFDSAVIPERIRIHSKHIVQELERLYGKRLHTSSMVMIRPFRTLMYYEQSIRSKVNRLATRFGSARNRVIPDQDRSPINEQKQDEMSEEVEDPKQFEDSEQSENSEPAEGVEDIQISDIDQAAGYEDLNCLVEFIDNEIQPRRQYLTSDNCKKVSFADLWFLFSPGLEIIRQDRKQVYRVLGVTSSRHRVIPPWQSLTSQQYRNISEKLADEAHVTLDCVYVDFDGDFIGPVRCEYHLFRFDGDVAVTSLPVYPLRLAKDPNSSHLPSHKSIRDRLIARGRTFLDIVRTKPMHYQGATLDTGDEVDSQVVIDFEQAFISSENTCEAPEVERFIEKVVTHIQDGHVCKAACCEGEEIHDDEYVEKLSSEDYMSSLVTESNGPTSKGLSVAIYARSLQDTSWEKDQLDDQDFLIMSNRVFGYVLRSRKWAHLDMDHITPIRSQTGEKDGFMGHPVFKTTLGEARLGGDETHGEKLRTAEQMTTFDQLVLPRNHKEIVLSLVAQHFQDRSSRNTEIEETDIVKGKGKGLIILLHGAPGVGKTTTAEGIAQVFNRPLFPITCGDLGTDAAAVEAALEKHFALANRWGCVLLLDEADVFLAERSPQDFLRNSLVAVFLRVLEYYAGVLFLTTNRIGDFDEAFTSRIHVSLYYPPLKLKPTISIFKLNLGIIQQRIEGRGVAIEIRETDILHFAERYWRKNKKLRWNGRQIRNACQTALALAEYEAQRGAVQDRRTLDAKAEAKREVNVAAKVDLTQRHLQKVADAYLQFMKYLKEIYGRDPERRAKAMGWRAREVTKIGKGPAGGDRLELHFSDQEDPEDDEDSDDEEVRHGLDKVPIHAEAHPRGNPSEAYTNIVSGNMANTQISGHHPPGSSQQQEPRDQFLAAQHGVLGMPMGGGNVIFPNMIYTSQMPMTQMLPQPQGQPQQQPQNPLQRWGAPTMTMTDAQNLALFQQQQAAVVSAQGGYGVAPGATGGVPLEQQLPRKPT